MPKRLLPLAATEIVALAVLADGPGAAAPLSLAIDSRSAYTIVQAAAVTPAERFAAQELASFLGRATGAALPLGAEASFEGGRAIYVGPTAFAAEHGIAAERLGPEEWVIRAVGQDVVIAGGRPRGTLYGVYEFLERRVGVRFLDPDTEFVPEAGTLTLPEGLTARGAPAFARREVFRVVPGQTKHTLFEVRRKANSFGNAAVASAGPELGYSFRFGSPYSTHTHHLYTEAFPPEKPEYFALTDSGSRTGPGPQGQVCLSHPEVRTLFAARLREYIRRDREEITRAGTGEPFPAVYAVVPNDNLNRCVCPDCRALAGKYGAYSGAVLDFTNALAAEVESDYPEVCLATAAYTYYVDLPRGLQPRTNVIVTLAQLGCEFHAPPLRDTLRSMAHPVNAEPRRILEEWGGISPALATHDYWTAWNQPFQWPQANIHGLAETLKLYHHCGMRHYFAEAELFGTRIHNFVDLQFYVATRLLQDPTQDVEPILAEFMEPYYGPAAPTMRRLLDSLEQRQEEQPGMLAVVPPSSRRYFDRAFFLEAEALLSEAEGRVRDDPERLAHVQQERLPFDETMLYLWPGLSGGGELPFARPEVLDRLRRQYEAAYRKYGGWGETYRAADEARLTYLADMPPLPPEFEGKTVIDLCGPQLDLRQAGGGVARAVEDPEAATGRAWALDAALPGAAGQHDALPEFGLSDVVRQPAFLARAVVERDDVPQDERFHWYHVGRMQASADVHFWAHHSWRLCQHLAVAYDALRPTQRTYDVHVSLKLEGPAYVPGSTKENAFVIDRVILVQVD